MKSPSEKKSLEHSRDSGKGLGKKKKTVLESVALGVHAKYGKYQGNFGVQVFFIWIP